MARKNRPSMFIGDWVEGFNPEPNINDPRRYLEQLNGELIGNDYSCPSNLPESGYQAKMQKDEHVYFKMRAKLKV